MPGDYASRRIGVAFRCGGGLGAGTVGTSIYVADLHAPLLVNSRIKEVEQIAAYICAAVHPDATALHRVLWRDVGGSPMQSSVESTRDVEMPDTTEAVCRLISRCRRAVESHGGATCIDCDCGGESNVFQTVNCAYVVDVLPS